jgi:biopolymer transport protein ExbD
MKIRRVAEPSEIEQQMVPMIDIVFQLLIFFIMTFKVAQMEGDFNIRMPSSAPSRQVTDDELLPPMKLRLLAGDNGQLAGIELNKTRFDSFAALHEHVRQFVGGGGAEPRITGAEIELDCDYGLNYEYAIAAITAVTGHRNEDNSITPLIEKIKFSPPKPAPGS